MNLWNAGAGEVRLDELALGGEIKGTKCPVEDEELRILCRGNFSQLHTLILHYATQLTDLGLCELANTLCGAPLTSLTLEGGVLLYCS